MGRRWFGLFAIALALASCEGPSKLNFSVGQSRFGVESSIVLCRGTVIDVDVGFSSHVGSAADFSIDHFSIDPYGADPTGVEASVATSGVAWTHTIAIDAVEPGQAVLFLAARSRAADDDVVWESLRVTVVDCP
jgi:hypothetical protein